MAIELATKYLPYVDEIFTAESKKSLLTNNDFSFDGAGTVKIYKISTSEMNDYGRNGASGNNWSRYGTVQSLDATTETMQLKRDRSFTFAIDKLDTNETVGQLEGASALARQVREVVVPEVDTYVYQKMTENAGTKTPKEVLNSENQMFGGCGVTNPKVICAKKGEVNYKPYYIDGIGCIKINL